MDEITLLETLKKLGIDEIYIKFGVISLVGHRYTDSFRGATFTEAIENAKQELGEEVFNRQMGIINPVKF